MVVGLLIALVGALLGIVGGFAVPWIDGDVVKFADASFYQGIQWVPGLVATILSIAGALVVIAGIVTHQRKALAITGLILAGLTFVALMLTPFSVRAVIVAMIAENLMDSSTQIAMYYGYHAMFLGTAMMVFGYVWTLGSHGAYGTEDRLLRVAQLWQGRLIRETTFTHHQNIVIGGDKNCDFVVPLDKKDPGSDKVMGLFQSDRKGTYKLALSRDFKGRLNIGGQLVSVGDYIKKNTEGAEGINYVSVDKGDWGVLRFDDVELFFQFVAPDVVVGRSTAMSMDSDFISATVSSAFVMATLWVISQFLWDPAGHIERHKVQKRVLKVETNITMEKDETLLEIGEEEDDVGKRAEGEEGKFGDPDKDPTLESKVPRRDGQMAAKIDPKSIGLADLLSNKMQNSGAISSILSDNADAFDNRMAVAMAGTGSELVVGYGAGGMGFKGTGPGGGGTGGYGRIHGLGRVDTGGGMGMRAGLGNKGAKKVGKMSLGGMGSTGFCQKGNIQSVVKQRAGAIRACYEAQLQIHEKLSGKMTVRWTINTDGRVEGSTITGSTLENKAVETCVMRAIGRMRFAKPDGGICVVQWPFVFNPG